MKTPKMMALAVLAMLMAGAVGHAQPQTELDILALLNRLRAILSSYEISVPADGDAQAIIESAPIGATVRLSSGTRLRRLSIRRPVTIIGDGAEIRAEAGGTCVVDVRPGTTDVLISGLRVTAAPGVSINDLVCLGHGDATQTALDQQPRRITFVGNTVLGNGLTKRGIAIHGADIMVLDNRVLNIARVGQDSSAIGGWNGEGRWTIENNELEGASENILIGGADPRIVGLVPTDITIRGNHLFKRLSWRGAGVGVKNLLELKTGRRVRIEDNLLEFNWVDGQTGWGIVLTPSQYGTNPQNSLEDIDIINNVLRETSSGINLLGSGQNSVTGITKRVHVSGNYISTNRAAYGGHGWILQVGRSPEDVELTQNTIEMPGSGQLVVVTDGIVEGLTITRNAVRSIGTYGIIGRANNTNQNRGNGFAIYAPGGTVTGNLFADAHAVFKSNFPGNTYVTTPRDTNGAPIGESFGIAADGWVDGEVGRLRR
jgi:hypothetical protein